MSKKEPIIGLVILAAGLFILLGKWGFFAFLGGTMWPLLVFLGGVLLFFLVRGRILPPIAFVPAGALLVYGVLFMISHWISWELFSYLWPFLLIGLSFGLFGYCQLDPYAPRGAWLLAMGLGALGVIMLLLMIFIGIGVYVIAIALILIGLALLFGGRLGYWRR
ncbi:glutamate synthase [Paenibacillus marinisediminis]